jgi:hypothetical protein
VGKGYALLYFTGNGHFNRSMRFFAGKKGLTLSDHGLCPTLKNIHGSYASGTYENNRYATGDPFPAPTEHDVFGLLGLEVRVEQNMCKVSDFECLTSDLCTPGFEIWQYRSPEQRNCIEAEPDDADEVLRTSGYTSS